MWPSPAVQRDDQGEIKKESCVDSVTLRDKTDRLARGRDRVLQCLAACFCPVPPLLLQTCWLEMRYKVACFSVCEIAASWIAGCLNQSFLEYSVSASVLVFALTGNRNASCSYRQPASFSGSCSQHLSCWGLAEPLQELPDQSPLSPGLSHHGAH